MIDTDEDKLDDDDDDEPVVFTRESVQEFVREMEIRTGQTNEPVVLSVEDALQVVSWQHGDPRPAQLRGGGAPRPQPEGEEDPDSPDK